MKANNIFTKSKLVCALGFVAILSAASVAEAVCFASVAEAASLANVAAAASFNTGFEKNDGYKVGPLNKQNGWQATPNVNIQNTVVHQGKQALTIGVTGGSYDDQYANAPLPYPIPITNRYTSVSFYFLTNNTSNNVQAGVNVIGANGSSSPGTLGQLVAFGTGNADSTYSLFSLGNSNMSTEPFVPLANGVWHSCILDFDFEANQVTGQIDGTINFGPLDITPATVITGVQLYNITGGITSTSDASFDLINISYNTGRAITP